MNKLQIPPHLHIALNVTAEEYRRAKSQHRVVLFISMLIGVVAAFPLIYFLGVFIGLAVTGVLAILVDRLLHSYFKEARKYKTNRLSKYLELKKFIESHKDLDM